MLIHIVKCPEFTLLKAKPKTDLTDNEISEFLSFEKNEMMIKKLRILEL